MRHGQRILSVIAVFMVLALAACSNSPKKPIAVTLSGTPPTSMAEGAAVSFTANVANDSANAGVTWTVTCGSAACGSFSSSSTASGVATTYTAPATIPSGGSVKVTATSVTDASQSASATITITAASSLADGTYVFSLSGQDVAGTYLYFVAGAFQVANGSIIGGEQDFVDYNLASTANDSISSGSVSTTADGNLQVVINTGNAAIGVAGTETLNGTLVNGGRALLTEFDASATSSGQLDLQTATSAGQGGFAFFVEGGDSSGFPAAVGGVINVTGSGAISGAGSVFDINDAGVGVLQNQPIDPSTLSAPDAFGRITVSLDLSTSGVGGIGLVAYVVDNSRVRLVENTNDPNDSFFGVTGGTAFAQGSNAGGFSAASVQGSSFVFGLNGQEPGGYLQVAGVLTTGAAGAVTGTLNFNDLTGAGVQAPVTFQGTYTVDSTGRVTMTNLIGGATVVLQAYLDGNGHAGLVSMDASDVLAGYVYQQTGGGSFTAGSFKGSYALNATGYGSPTGPELDAVGLVTSDGVALLNGTVDLNALNSGQTAGITLTDGFSANANGIFTGTITGLDLLPGSQDAYAYYLVDTTKVVAIETDPNQLTLGYFELQQ
jgi:hypothetical protein